MTNDIEYQKKYYIKNREHLTFARKEYRLKNKEKVIARNKDYKLRNKEKLAVKKKDYRLKNEEKIAIRGKIYRLEHKKQIVAYQRERRKTDISYHISCALRSRLSKAIKNNYKSSSAVKDLGCTILEFKFYLEGKFTDGMTWENYGFYGWHIDHIIPLAFFDLTNREQFLKAVHYTNLQPLWALENIIKSDKIIMV